MLRLIVKLKNSSLEIVHRAKRRLVDFNFSTIGNWEVDRLRQNIGLTLPNHFRQVQQTGL
jgi:hypothetical protein